ncbi:MAG: hypothetical protein WAZ18_03310 [Alphaproteobacteria bacterium]
MILQGHVITDKNGFYADKFGVMPPTLKRDDDFALLQSHLSNIDLCIMGRKTHEAHSNVKKRRRLVLSQHPERHLPQENTLFMTLDNAERWLVRNNSSLTSVAVLGGKVAYEWGLGRFGYQTFHWSIVTGLDLGMSDYRFIDGTEGQNGIYKRLSSSTKTLEVIEY